MADAKDCFWLGLVARVAAVDLRTHDGKNCFGVPFIHSHVACAAHSYSGIHSEAA